MGTKAFGGIAAATSAAAILLLPTAASAAHNPGLYAGPVEGGGTVEIEITADTVTRFSVTNIHTYSVNQACAPVTMTYAGTLPVAHTNVLFSNFSNTLLQPDPLEFDGYADRPNELSGRLSYRASPDPTACASAVSDSPNGIGNLRWTATRDGGCLNSPQYLTAKATLDRLQAEASALHKKIKKLSKQAKKAEKQGKEDKAKRLERKRRKAFRQRTTVRRELEVAQTAFEYACPGL